MSTPSASTTRDLVREPSQGYPILFQILLQNPNDQDAINVRNQYLAKVQQLEVHLKPFKDQLDALQSDFNALSNEISARKEAIDRLSKFSVDRRQQLLQAYLSSPDFAQAKKDRDTRRDGLVQERDVVLPELIAKLRKSGLPILVTTLSPDLQKVFSRVSWVQFR